MMRLRLCAIVVLVLLARSAGALKLEGDVGNAWNIHTPLTIVQSGQPDLHFSAAYDTNALKPAPYYWLRTDLHTGKWWFSFIHHKIYLGNPPPEVQHFEVSHGYNLLTLSREFDLFGILQIEVGPSVVVAHPHTTIRGLSNREGYDLVGAGGLLGVGRRFTLIGPLYLRVEGALTGAWASIPVANGHAETPNVALHGIVGLGLDLF